jgi:hypothetical protein
MSRSPLVVLVALALVSLGAACGSAGPPLEHRAGGAVSTNARAHVGDSVSIGVIDVDRYTGAAPAVFDQVVPNEAVEGVRILGYGIVALRGDAITSVDGFPPEGPGMRPLRGFELAPGDGPVQVVVGLELTHDGVHHIEGFTLRYHVGSKRFEQSFDQGASVCSFGFSAC